MQGFHPTDVVRNDAIGTRGHTPYEGELPERLRRRATGAEYDPVLRAIAPDLLEAADEIERLTAQLDRANRVLQNLAFGRGVGVS